MNNTRWEDMVFVNRNRSYGAYLLRKAYPDRVTASFAFAMIVVTLLLASPIIKSMFGNEPIARAKIIPDIVHELKDLPPIKVEVQKVEPPQQKIKTTQFVPPVVTNKDVEEEIPTIKDLQDAQTSNQTSEGEAVFVDTPPAIATLTGEGEDVDKVHNWVETPPEFPGGVKEMMKFIGKNIKYPSIARRVGTEGLVYISFVVDSDGTITNVSTMTGIGSGCDEEAMRVVSKMPPWKAGKQNGKAVKVRFVLPIKFSLGGA